VRRNTVNYVLMQVSIPHMTLEMLSGYEITRAQKLLICRVCSHVQAATSLLFPYKALRIAVKKSAEQVGLNYQNGREIISAVTGLRNEHSGGSAESRKPPN
jgi:hypothetical protein